LFLVRHLGFVTSGRAAMISISVVKGDLLSRECDLLILKHADAFHGVDAKVASRIGFSGDIKSGRHAIMPGRRAKAEQVLFLGVGPLYEFRYPQIRKFGQRALAVAAKVLPEAEHVCMPIHGPNYGLDESEAFLSLIGGLADGIGRGDYPEGLKKVEIVELDGQRVGRLRHILENTVDMSSIELAQPTSRRAPPGSREVRSLERQSAKTKREQLKVHEDLSEYGAASERKPKLFVAMPFKSAYRDEYNIAILEAAQYANVVCERIDKEAYVGDIMSQVRNRIESYHGMVAILNEANPNVFLEIGYAWAKNKPTVLIIKKRQKLPFDIGGQKCIVYSDITDLRDQLKSELKSLNDNGTFSLRGRRLSQ
jgi:hypothetical protein